MNHINKTIVTQWSKGMSAMLKDAKACTSHGCKHKDSLHEECKEKSCVVHMYIGSRFIALMTLLEEEPDGR